MTWKGYGSISLDGKAKAAHRVSYAFAKGDPGDKHVLHTCDNRKCVNPAHLFLGTNRDNQQDKNRKGRAACGERHGRTKLTDAQVDEIRASKDSARVLARTYGVTEAHVRKLINRVQRTKKAHK